MPKTKRRTLSSEPLSIVPNPSLARESAGDDVARRLAANEPLMYVEDVQERLGRKPSGAFQRSSWWVRMHVAPDKKFHLVGKAVWFKADVEAWLLAQYAQRKTA